MTQKSTREELSARLIKAGALEVLGAPGDEIAAYFAENFSFHGPGGYETDYAGLSAYFASIREAFDDRSIRRGIMIVEGNLSRARPGLGGGSRELTMSPAGPLPPKGGATDLGSHQ